MITGIDYWTENGALTVCRLYGTGKTAYLPEEVGGMPLAALSDHAFAAEPSDETSKRNVMRAVRRMGESARDGSPVWHVGSAAGMDLPGDVQSADKTEQIVLPESLQRIGNYAFYGCRNLWSVTFPSHKVLMGSGAFVDCGHMKRVVFPVRAADEEHPQLREILGELPNETEAVMTVNGEPAAALVFPGYYEDSVENTPARIFIMHYEGTGFKYRQCFRNGKIDFNLYDSIFYETSVQETTETALRVAMNRLRRPVSLTKKNHDRYMEFVLENYPDSAAMILGADDEKMLEIVCESPMLSRKVLEYFMETARKTRAAKALGYLQETHRRLYPPVKKEYRF